MLVLTKRYKVNKLKIHFLIFQYLSSCFDIHIKQKCELNKKRTLIKDAVKNKVKQYNLQTL